MAIRMKTLKEHVYANKRLKPGAPFEARGEADARLLQALGRAERAVAQPPAAPTKTPALLHRTAEATPPVAANPPPALQAETPATPGETPAVAIPGTGAERVSPRTGRPVRTYQRRDMTAEGNDE